MKPPHVKSRRSSSRRCYTLWISRPKKPSGLKQNGLETRTTRDSGATWICCFPFNWWANLTAKAQFAIPGTRRWRIKLLDNRFRLWCAAKCPPKWPNCRSTLNQLLQALDPDGATPRPTRRAVPLPVDNHDIVSLQQMAPENQRHCDQAPRDGEDDDETCTDTTAAVPYEGTGTDAAGYRVLAAQDLLRDSTTTASVQAQNSTAHHGRSCLARYLLVDVRTHERHGGKNDYYAVFMYKHDSEQHNYRTAKI